MNINCRFTASIIVALQGLALPVAAEVVLYDNSHGDFTWLPQTSTGAPFNYFDPTQPPTQSGEQTPFGLTHTSLFPETSTMVAVNSIGAGGGIEIAVEDSFTVHGSEGSQATVTPAKTFRFGEAVGPAADWANGADHYWRAIVDGRVPLLGDPPIIGFRTETNGQHQYGWIELGLRMFEAPHFGLHYQPIRWAYETELNTPITVIPEPATIGSLLLCLLAATSQAVVWSSVFRSVRLPTTLCPKEART